MPTLANDRHERFCQEYLVDLNGGRAYERAGYKAKGNAAEVGAHGLLRNTKVAARIAELQAERAARVQVTSDDVVRELVRLGFADLRGLMTWEEERAAFVPSSNLTDDQAATVQSIKAKTTHRTIRGREGEPDEKETSIELEIKAHDKLSALDKLAKHLGMYGPSGSADNPIHHAVTVRRVNEAPNG